MLGLTKEEYERRAEYLETIEGYFGPDNGFVDLKTETLAYLFHMIVWIRKRQKDNDS